MISWDRLALATAADASLGHLLRLIEQGTPRPDSSTDDALRSCCPIHDSLYTEDGILLYQDRVVVPPSLRDSVLQHLHAAH